MSKLKPCLQRNSKEIVIIVRVASKDRLKQKKKNILYLILNHVQAEGLFKTAECLVSEARLNDDIQVCDNVDLEIIYQEYCNYHFLKHDKYPAICKKRESCNENDKPIVALIKSYKTMQVNNEENKGTVADEPIEKCMTVQKLSEKENDVSKVSHIRTRQNDITDFMAHVPSEYKSFVEDVYRHSNVENRSLKWEDIVGLDSVKSLLKETCVYPSIYPELFQGLASPWKGILLYGPPGVGKTLLAKVLADECDRFFINITPSSIISKWRGNSEKQIKIVFDLARYYAPSIIFIDEIESIASKRDQIEHDAARRLKTEILIELDGMGNNFENVLFLVTSNLPWEIDPALLRRLEKRICVSLPNFEARVNMFKNFLKTYTSHDNIDFKLLALKTEGYSSSDIRNICRETCMSEVRKMFHEENGDEKSRKFDIQQEDLETAIDKIKPAAIYNVDKFVNWSKSVGAE